MCELCGGPGHAEGCLSCRMHDSATENRLTDEAHQRGELRPFEKTYEQARHGLWATRRAN